MTFEESVRLLLEKHVYVKKTGLEKVRQVLEKLGNPHKGLKTVHVTGTNGKGSVCATLESILCEAGYKTGSFTSPHLVNITERIKICGQNISCLLYTSPSPRDLSTSRMPSSA